MHYTNHIVKLVIFISILSFIFSACGIKEEWFSDIETGENFYSNIDGHCKKLPHNYCLDIDLSSTARIYRVPEDLLNIPFGGDSDHPAVYNSVESIIEGPFY